MYVAIGTFIIAIATYTYCGFHDHKKCMLYTQVAYKQLLPHFHQMSHYKQVSIPDLSKLATIPLKVTSFWEWRHAAGLYS